MRFTTKLSLAERRHEKKQNQNIEIEKIGVNLEQMIYRSNK